MKFNNFLEFQREFFAPRVLVQNPEVQEKENKGIQ